MALAKVALEEPNLFNETEREAIVEELRKIGSRENEYGLRWGTQPNQQYRAHRVGDGIRIYFRQREKANVMEPDSYLVLGFQKCLRRSNPAKSDLAKCRFDEQSHAKEAAIDAMGIDGAMK